MVLVKGGAAARRLGVSVATLRQWDRQGRIAALRTPGGTRLYDVDSFLAAQAVDAVAASAAAVDAQPGQGCLALGGPAAAAVADPRVAIAYCRVSSAGQKADLERQVAHMRERCPGAEVVADVGSGLNFKRKGLKAVLERALQGTVRSVTVAHRDRLCRFGFELVKWLLERQRVELVVLDDEQQSPECEFTEDLLAIVHVFSCRFNGLRRYRKAAQEAVEGRKRKGRPRAGRRARAGAGVQDAESPAPPDPRPGAHSPSLDGRC
jgi:predicted site-specific integrase-resolvase